MKRIGLVTLGSLVFGLIMVMGSYPAGACNAGSTGSSYRDLSFSDHGMSSDQDRFYAAAPESEDEFNTPSGEGMFSDRHRFYGTAPESRDQSRDNEREWFELEHGLAPNFEGQSSDDYDGSVPGH